MPNLGPGRSDKDLRDSADHLYREGDQLAQKRGNEPEEDALLGILEQRTRRRDRGIRHNGSDL